MSTHRSIPVTSEITDLEVKYNEVLRLLSKTLRQAGGQVKFGILDFLSEDKFADFPITYETIMQGRMIVLTGESPKRKAPKNG